MGRAAVRAHPSGVQWTREIGLQVLRRIVTLGFTLLTLFFVCVNRERLRQDVPFAARRLFGPTVMPILDGVISAIRATVDGIVLVSDCRRARSWRASTPWPPRRRIRSSRAFITGIFAMVPFAAPIVFESAVGPAPGVCPAP